MRDKMRKLGQAVNPNPGNNPPPPPDKKTSFTRKDLTDAISLFKKGLNQAESIGLVSSPAPSVASGILSGISGIMIGKPGSSYLEQRFSLGISKSEREQKNSIDKDNLSIVYSSFNSRVLTPAARAYQCFEALTKYAEELNEGKKLSTLINKSIINNYATLHSSLVDVGEEHSEAKSILNSSIDELSDAFEKVKNISNAQQSIINQLLLKSSTTSIGVSAPTNVDFLENYSISNFPASIKDALLKIAAEVKTLGMLIDYLKNIVGQYNSVSSIPVPGSSSRTPTSQTPNAGGGPSSNPPQVPGPPSNSSSPIISVRGSQNFAQDRSHPNSIQLHGVGASSSPTFAVFFKDIPGVTFVTAHEALTYFIRNGFLKINSFSGSSPGSNPGKDAAIAKVHDIVSNQNSNNVSLSLAPEARIGGYKLGISLSNQVAQELSRHSQDPIFEFVTQSSGKLIVRAGLNNYKIDTGFSKISFTAKDLINDSSNISKLNRQKILEKIKNE